MDRKTKYHKLYIDKEHRLTMEQAFLNRAVELTKEIQKEKTLEDMKQKAHNLEGYLMGAIEIFSVMNEIKQ